MKHSAWFRRESCGGQGDQVAHAGGRRGGRVHAAGRRRFSISAQCPAGNLYATAGDLARFVAMWAADGEGPGGRVLEPGTLAEMWKPQLDEKGGFGLGFALGEWRGRKTVGHSGAVFGHSTVVQFIPQEKIGVVVLCNEDIVSGRTQRLPTSRSRSCSRPGYGEKPPARAGRGECRSGRGGAAWPERGNPRATGWSWSRSGVCAAISPPSRACSFKQIATGWLLRSRIHDDLGRRRARRSRRGCRPGGGHAAVHARARTPPSFRQRGAGCSGVTAPSSSHWSCTKSSAVSYVTTENMVDYRLTPVNRHVFRLPPGMYVEEELCSSPGGRTRLGREFRQHDPAAARINAPIR